MDDSPRYFTPAEANATLEAVEDDLAVLVAGVTRALALTTAVAESDDGHLAEELAATKRALESRIAAVEQRGARVEGLVPLRLAFPALRFGAACMLSWQDGDPGVVTWHPRERVSPRRLIAVEPPGAFEWVN